jgi:hypothetical protein
MNIEPQPLQEEQPINLPDPDYTPPMMLTSKLAKNKVANHLDFLKQLTQSK